MVEAVFDESLIDEAAIRATLASAGYLDPLPAPVEVSGGKASANGRAMTFRHTMPGAPGGRAIQFARDVPNANRPLWPCPGLGVVSVEVEEEKDNG
jgi:hypothetical protein